MSGKGGTGASPGAAKKKLLSAARTASKPKVAAQNTAGVTGKSPGPGQANEDTHAKQTPTAPAKQDTSATTLNTALKTDAAPPSPSSSSTKILKGPPEKPVIGKHATLLANFFKIDPKHIKTIYRYNLEIKKVLTDEEEIGDRKKEVAANQSGAIYKPRGVSARVRKRVIFLMIKYFTKPPHIATDFNSKMYTFEPLQQRGVPTTLKSSKTPARVVFYDEDKPVRTTGSSYDITITMNLLSPDNILEQKAEITSALNVILSHRPNQLTIRSVADNRQPQVTNVGAQKFYSTNQAGEKLEHSFKKHKNNGLGARAGFFRSVRSSEVGLALNINTATSAFYTPQNLAAAIAESFPHGRASYAHNLGAIESWVKGIRVNTAYLEHSSRARGRGPIREKIYTVSGFPVTTPPKIVPTPVNIFFTPQGQPNPKSVWQHFQEAHQLPTAMDGQGLVVAAGKLSLPVQFLRILPGQFYKQKTEMNESATRWPGTNYTKIMDEGLPMFGLNDANLPYSPLNPFQISVGRAMERVKATRLPKTSVGYLDGRNPRAIDDLARGKWDFKKRNFIKSIQNKSLCWSYIELQRSPDTFHNEPGWNDIWADRLQGALAAVGIDCTRALWKDTFHRIQIPGKFDARDSAETATAASLKAKMERMNRDKKFTMFFVLLPEKGYNLHYQCVKRMADQKLGFRTICHVSRMYSHTGSWGGSANPGILSNLALKFNIKMGWAVQTANQALIGQSPVLDADTMIVGIDVTHPGASALEDSPSIAAMVGSVDVNFAQFPASFRRNPRPEIDKNDTLKKSMEQILRYNLESMVKERLTRYHNVRRKLPTRIVIYHDGLSADQFDMCRLHELPAIRSGISQFYQQHNKVDPPIILICAVKRNHCRFFEDKGNVMNPSILDKNKNPLPGTLVDSGVTYTDEDDFFLISHKAVIGTARPAHYVVLANDLKDAVTKRHIAEMTNNLCSTFQRSTTQVGVCPPIYYADLAADRARCYVKDVYAPRSHVIQYTAGHVDSDANFNLKAHEDLKHSMFYL